MGATPFGSSEALGQTGSEVLREPWLPLKRSQALLAGAVLLVFCGSVTTAVARTAERAGSSTAATSDVRSASGATTATSASTGPTVSRHSDSSIPTAPPSRPSSLVATAVGAAVPVFESPGAPTPKLTLDNPQPSGAPLVFLVLRQQPGWLQVLLPVRPNGSAGWVQQRHVSLTMHDFTIVVELRAHRVTVFQGGRVILQEPVGVGVARAPTPGGLYYTKELLKPPDPNTAYGPYAYGLSGFSNVLTSFNGGDAVIGLHGTNDPGGLGKDVSSGCIRMSNEGISRLAHTLPLGVPVEIRP